MAKPPLADLLQKARGELSQARLSALSGVSNKTISLIEHGSIVRPSVVARLAVALDQDVWTWLKAAGHSYEAAVEERARHFVEERRTKCIGRPGLGGTVRNSLADIRRHGIVKCRIIQYGQFSEPLNDYPGKMSFFHGLLDLLIAAAGGGRWTLEIKPADSISQIVAEAQAGGPDWHLVMGMFADPCLREAGLDFIPLPGLSIQLNAVWNPAFYQELVQKSCGPRTSAVEVSMNWEDIQYHRAVCVVTPTAEIGDTHMRCLCHYDEVAGEIYPAPDNSPETLLKEYHEVIQREEQEARRMKRLPRRVVIVADEYLCARLIHRDPALVWLEPLHESKKDEADQHSAPQKPLLPLYNLAIALAEGDEDWKNRLEAILSELCNSARPELANLYPTLASNMAEIWSGLALAAKTFAQPITS